MALPKQAQEQIKVAQKIEAAIVAEHDTVTGKKQAEIDAFLKDVDGEEAAPLAVEPPASEENPLLLDGEEAPVEGEPTTKKPRKDFKQMYNVLQGKYDAEVPRLHSDIKALTAQVAELRDSLTTPAVKEPSATTATTYIQPEELEEYGEDLLNVIGRKAKEIVETEYRPLINKLNTEIDSLKGVVGNTGQRVDLQEQNQVFAQLDRDVENWRVTNEAPAFKEWLGGVDLFSGRTRQAMMLEAFHNRDIALVKNFFNSFHKENAAVSTTGTAGQPIPGKPTLDLENYVAPTATAGGAQQEGAPKQKRVWAQAEIAKFYSDVQKGHYKNRDKDRMKIDREIGTAVSENRVR